MKTLPPIRPTPEQLPLISENRLGVEVIRGAAGSGKTSTGILRLRSLAYMFEERRDREGNEKPVKILVLTFNRTLRGYVQTLVDEQVQGLRNTEVTVDTFSRWAMRHLGMPNVVKNWPREGKLKTLAGNFSTPSADYLIKEVDYLLGRFPSADLLNYLSTVRTGRGTEPRVDQAIRQKILDEIIWPYKEWLIQRGELDWNDVAIAMASSPLIHEYDIVVVDETQDFSANQLRAIRHHLAEDSAVTFVIDTVQRIYARGFSWAETGFEMTGARYHLLRQNHRNTRQVAEFAAGILAGVVVEEDGALPDLTAALRDGDQPSIIRGKFSLQAQWAIRYIENNIDLSEETVAFLHPQGGGYFDALRGYLAKAGIDFVEITREAEWPDGDENVALSTFHSAKGLEFDHVFILGLSHEVTLFADASRDDQIFVLRKLLAVAVARAKNTVVIGYKDQERSRLVDYFADGTFRTIDL